MKTLLIIGCSTGMRLQDCAKLRWGDCDFKTGTVNVKTRKTGASVVIPIMPILKEELRRLKRSGGYVLPNLCLKDSSNLSNAVKYLFKKAGIKTSVSVEKGKQKRPSCGFHSLRHRFITKAIEAGVPIEVVKAVVGHSSYLMTEHYTHISNEIMMREFEKMGVKQSLNNY